MEDSKVEDYKWEDYKVEDSKMEGGKGAIITLLSTLLVPRYPHFQSSYTSPKSLMITY